MEQSRVCTKCGQLKNLTEFHKATSERLGVIAQCKVCRKNYAALYHSKNRDRNNARNKAWAKSNKSTINRIASDWRKSNPNKVKEIQKTYRLKNSNLIAQRRKNRLEYSRNAWNKRKAQKANNGVFAISKKELSRLYSQPCFYCGKIGKIEMDHVIPIKLGGRHSIGNLVPACLPCNRSKAGKLLIVWKNEF
jgi:5-methylcytosine-specific restriction endonuclease McrA